MVGDEHVDAPERLLDVGDQPLGLALLPQVGAERASDGAR